MTIKAFIDPNMFELKKENEIKRNIDFFKQVMNLCNQNKLKIVMYNDLLKKLKNREIFPFPINVSGLSTSNLKEKVLQINQNFTNSMVNAWILEDIDVCSGDQDLSSNPKLDDCYFELLSIMISSCYKKRFGEATNVLVGDVENAQKCGFELELSCLCSSKKFLKNYRWISPNELLSNKDKYLVELRKISLVKCETPKLNKGNHHAPYMPQNKQLDTFWDIPYNSRRVLEILLLFGLFSIIIKDFHNDTSKTEGTIIITRYVECATYDSLYGKLYFNKGFHIVVELKFPVSVGKCIKGYCGEEIDYKTIEELATSLSLI